MKIYITKRKNKGSSTVIVILISLTLIIFGVLNFMMTYSSYRISQKNADATSEYYSLDSEAQIFLSKLDKSIKSNSNEEILNLSAVAKDLTKDYKNGLVINGKENSDFNSLNILNAIKIEKYIQDKNGVNSFYIDLNLMQHSISNGKYYEITSYKRLPTSMEYKQLEFAQGEEKAKW